MADESMEPGDQVADGQTQKEVERIRNIVAAVYTFVRAAEVNRTIASFTFDHYIDEEKRAIKGEGRAIRDAAGEAFDKRPTKLEIIENLEKEFRSSYTTIEKMAKKKDAADRVNETISEGENA